MAAPRTGGMIRVIEWPQTGSGKWWVVNEREGRFTPLAGPFPSRAKAEVAAKEHAVDSAGAEG